MQHCNLTNSHTARITNFDLMLKTLNKIICFLFFFCAYQISLSAKEASLQLEVLDPYIELHSGPGRGYPVFYTIEQGESIEVLTRRTGWYEIRAQSGQTGWAVAKQVARTLLPTGEPVDLPSVSYGDYLKNTWVTGFKVGQFNSGILDGSDTFSFVAGYRPLDYLQVELEDGKFYQSELRGSYRSINVLFEPFTEWQVSPVLTLGKGSMKIQSQPELTPLNFDKDDFKSYGISANYYLGRNYVFNVGYQKYILSTTDDNERLTRWTIGFNAFF